MSSLPAGQNTWLKCPGCGEIEDVWRLGVPGVPPSRIGSRQRVPDPKRFKCNFCGTIFTSDGATRRECMGYDPTAEVAV